MYAPITIDTSVKVLFLLLDAKDSQHCQCHTPNETSQFINSATAIKFSIYTPVTHTRRTANALSDKNLFSASLCVYEFCQDMRRASQF